MCKASAAAATGPDAADLYSSDKELVSYVGPVAPIRLKGGFPPSLPCSADLDDNMRLWSSQTTGFVDQQAPCINSVT